MTDRRLFSITPLCAAAALSLGLLSACAPTSPAAEGAPSAQARACFRVNDVNGFSEGPRGGDRIYLRAGVRDTYEVQTLGGCPDIDWALSVGLDPDFGGPRRCVGDTVRLITPRLGGGGDRCLARVTRKLTDEERRAL